MNKSTSIFIFSLLLVGAGLLATGAHPVAGQQPQPTPSDDAVNQIARQLYCPVCENIPLDVCPTQACHDWRELIRQKLAQGWSEQQIRDYFAAQYGDRVLDEPPTRGLNWIVYLAPPAGLLVGAVIVWRVITTSHKKNGQAGQPMSEAASIAMPDDPYIARLEVELKNKEKE